MGTLDEVLTLEPPPAPLELPALPAAAEAAVPAAAAAEAPEIWSVRLSLLGAALAVPGLAFLLGPSIAARSPAHIASFALYGVGLLSMFLASAVYHSQAGRERTFSKCVDYGAIGLMIAGNFTPYCAVVLRTAAAHQVLALLWALALAALTIRFTRSELSKWVFIAIFLAMGWLGALLALPLWRALGDGGAGLTLLGGLIYTAGTVFFNRFDGDVELPGFSAHDVWHVFILAAAGTHYLVLLLYMTPGR